MEVENSSDDFNRTQSQSPPAENLSDTRPSRSRSRSPSPVGILYGGTSSDDDEDDPVLGVYDADDHAWCKHGTSKEELEVFDEYFKQVRDSQGYEVNLYPGCCMYVRFIPCDVNEQFEFFNDASRKCITEYNKKHSEEPDYELLDVLMATKRPCAGYNYYITFRARQVGLPDDMVKTFRAEYYFCKFRGNYGKVYRCEPKDEYVERMRRCKESHDSACLCMI